ncbi:phage morphogenesis protein [Riemerella anatipestifer]|uniref:phage morphogenesis protein n=1 Tax=Riemerella anatipestifer TaxID=34085 RepID=UPI0030BBFD7A
MGKDLRDLQAKLNEVAQFVQNDIIDIIAIEGEKFIQKNFEDEGFNDGGLQPWKELKTTDKRGRDITRYRTNRVGKMGALNRYGSKLKDRPILTGHGSGGNKLRHSINTKKEKDRVVYSTPKDYAKRHNEGLDGMPARPFMKKSKTLNKNIETKATKKLDKIFKQ